MPTPRKSVAELALSGALQNRPKRYQNRFEQEPTASRPLGRPPAHYAAAHKAVWAEIVRYAPEGMLTRHDRLAVEIAVSLVLKVRAGHAKTADVTALTALLAKLGMTPADRKRMNYEPPVIVLQSSEPDPWDEFEESESR